MVCICRSGVLRRHPLRRPRRGTHRLRRGGAGHRQGVSALNPQAIARVPGGLRAVVSQRCRGMRDGAKVDVGRAGREARAGRQHLNACYSADGVEEINQLLLRYALRHTADDDAVVPRRSARRGHIPAVAVTVRRRARMSGLCERRVVWRAVWQRTEPPVAGIWLTHPPAAQDLAEHRIVHRLRARLAIEGCSLVTREDGKEQRQQDHHRRCSHHRHIILIPIVAMDIDIK